MLGLVVKPPGAYRIAGRAGRTFDALVEPELRRRRRAQRIVESLRSEILEGGGGRHLRIRRIFRSPREVFRLELELPDLGYQRTTLLDRDALDALLEQDDVRALVRTSDLRG